MHRQDAGPARRGDAISPATPNVSPKGKTEVELRKLMDVEDFVENLGDAFTPNEEIAKVKF